MVIRPSDMGANAAAPVFRVFRGQLDHSPILPHMYALFKWISGYFSLNETRLTAKNLSNPGRIEPSGLSGGILRARAPILFQCAKE